MFDITTEGYSWEINSKGDYVYVRADDPDIDLDSPNSMYITTNRFRQFQTVLATYPYALIVVDNMHLCLGDAMEEFLKILDGNWYIARSYKPGTL